MCHYHYISFSNCQHVSLYKVSYCDKANVDSAKFSRLSPYHSGADGAPVLRYQHSASSAEHIISDSHSSHINHNMYTVVRSGTGHSFADSAVHAQDGEQSHEHSALIPRSALHEDESRVQNAVAHVSSLLDTEGHRSLNIDIPMSSPPSMSMEVTHNGLFEHEPRTLGKSTRHGSVSEAGTIRGASSPRKPIPAQWLVSSNGPNLATAQRAKERGHKRGSASGSPIEAKTLSGTRSLLDMGRSHGTDGASFLTKTAHAAMESDLTSPPSAKSAKHQRTLSKPAWNSPTASSSRHDSSQQPNFTVKTSPSRAIFVGADAEAVGDGRVANNAANPVGDFAPHYAGRSPVRSPAGFMLGFLSAARNLNENDHMFWHHSHTDHGDKQTLQKPSRFLTSTKAATVGKASKPGLKIEIPPTNPHPDTSEGSATSHSSASGSFAIDVSPQSPVLATAISRIPRLPVARASSTARAPTRSSTLKRAQSAKTLKSPEGTSLGLSHGTQRAEYISPSAGPVRHVRTTNSSGTTPILSRQHTPERTDHANNMSTMTEADLRPAQRKHATIERAAQLLGATQLNTHRDPSIESLCTENTSSRASSTSTVKATPIVRNPDVVDSAIIYSKKMGDSGTFHDNIVPHQGGSAASASTQGVVQDPSPVRGRTEHFVPTARRQAESEPSLKSSLTSDLRATAPDFVPHPTPAVGSNGAEVKPETQAGSIAEFLGPVKYELDMYGLPWAYYMYQVQLAYDQGFRTGRSRSPKKIRQKKHRSSISSPTGALQVQKAPAQQSLDTTAMPPPLSTVPLSVQRTQKQQDSAIESANEAPGTSKPGDAGAESRSVSPFSAQRELIDRYNAFHGLTVTDRFPPDVDLTTIRNVGLPNGPRNAPLQGNLTNTMPSRSRASYTNNRRFNNRSDNGLYTHHNRGVAGMRLHDTVPFPDPVPPQGRPVGSVVGSEACEAAMVAYAAERVAGESCYGCEPDHPLE